MAKQEQNRPKEETVESTPIEEQARDQTGQARIRVRIDERDLKTSYANVFKPTASAEEVLLDFGLNIMLPPGGQKADREIIFHANNRIIMNYYAAKRLAIMLSQIVRRYEQEFGELELNAAKRRVSQKK